MFVCWNVIPNFLVVTLRCHNLARKGLRIVYAHVLTRRLSSDLESDHQAS